MKKYLVFIIFIPIIYFNTPLHINHYLWKSNVGGRISDCIVFNGPKSYDLKWPFIYKNQEKLGFILFCVYDRLWIYSYKSGTDNGIGQYVAKGKYVVK